MPSQMPPQVQMRLRGTLAAWGAPDRFLAALLEHHTPVRHARDSVIFRQGSPSDVFFLVMTGFAKVYCKGPTRRILLRLAGPGDIIGHADLPDYAGAAVRALEARALTRCDLALFTRQHLFKLLESLDTGTLVRLLEHVNAWWSAALQRHVTFLGLSFRERLEEVMNDLGARFGVRDARGVLLTPEITHEDLAEMIGSSRPMVSRLLAEMADDEVISRSGRQYILRNSARRRRDRSASLSASTE